MKYEYATVPLLTHATKQILDTWGSDGWELVQVIPAPGSGEQLVAYMKREVKVVLKKRLNPLAYNFQLQPFQLLHMCQLLKLAI